MTSSDSEGQAPTRKRARKNNRADDGADSSVKEGKKARGRPRVDTNDATAADRRRTQIRLAQRAYRQRKETTIVSLKQQSMQLHSVIEQMNSTFAKFAESALKSGLVQVNATLALELKHANETFNALSKAAAELDRIDDENGDAAEQTGDTAPTQPPPSHTSQAEEPRDIGWGYFARNEPTQVTTQPPPSHTSTHSENYLNDPRGGYGMPDSTSVLSRRQYTVSEVVDQSRSSQQGPGTSEAHQQPLPFGFIDLLGQSVPFNPPHPDIFSVNIPTPDITPPMTRLPTPPMKMPNPITNKTLAPIFTYSHDETTFARRLTRATLETGFHLISNANARPAALNYVFKLSLPYFSLEQLRAKFRLMLARGIDEDLDFWGAPFIHLGGAGTHYPRRDAHGNIIRKTNNWTIRQIGPLEKKMVRLECVDDGRLEDVDGIDLSAFEGEWFDAHDVEGYLAERFDCRIDPKSSFAQCIVEDEEPHSPADQAGWRLPASQPTLNSYLPPPPPPGLPRNSSDATSNPPSLTSGASVSSSAGSTPPSATAYHEPEAPFGLDMSFNNPTYASTNDFTKFNTTNISFDQALGLDLAPGIDYGFPVATNFATNMNVGLGMLEPLPVVRQKRKRTVWLETNKLIDELIKHAICLGRAPGYRRKDVDMAVREAMVAAF